MPDFTQVIAMLEDIRRLAATAEIDAKLDAVEQELGLLAGDVPPVEPVIPPSVQIPGFEIYGGAETERFPDCCAIERAQLLDGNWKVRPAAGKVFNRSTFGVVPIAPPGGMEVRFFDFAATETVSYTHLTLPTSDLV